MKVAFFEFNQNPWHLGLAFEIAQNEVASGNQVEFYFLGHSAAENNRNIYIHKNRLIRESFLPESRIGKRLEKKHAGKFKYLNKISILNQDLSFIPDRSDYAEIAAKNDLIDQLRDSKPDFYLHRKELRNKSAAYLQTYRLISGIVKRKKFGRIYTFNGRFLHEKAVWDAANDLKVPCYFHEKFEPNWGNRYWIFKKGVHNSGERAQVINEYWDSQTLDVSEKLSIAQNWLNARRHGKSQNYTKLQKSGHSIGIDDKFILFLHSSDDELIASGLGYSEFWGRQEKALIKLSDYFTKNPELKLVIRAHPNLMTRSENEKIRWLGIFNQVNAIIIRPEASIDTYQLIIDSEAVITFGSTAGIETSLLGKPSLLLGPALHSDLNATIPVQSEEELAFIVAKLKDKSLEISSCVLQAHKYALFYARGGQKFTFNQVVGSFDSQDPEMKVAGIKLKYRSKIQKITSLSNKFF
jgi:hypothetical protein